MGEQTASSNLNRKVTQAGNNLGGNNLIQPNQKAANQSIGWGTTADGIP